MNIEIINPIEYPNWDELLLTNDQTTFFHTSAWARVLSESYRYKPLYFSVFKEGKLSALIPMMEINSFLTGKRGVSLPFTDECHPLAKDASQFNNLLKNVVEYGKKSNWKKVELRGGQKYLEQKFSNRYYYKHTLKTDQSIEKVFHRFKGNVKRNIRKAQKAGLEVLISQTWDSVRKFHLLNCLTRKIHGLPPQPLKFFHNIFKYIIEKKCGFVTIASYHKMPVAGAVFLKFNNTVLYKYGASDRRFLKLRPNNLVMWEAIKWLVNKGFKRLDFGRTEPENRGLLQFKRGWGTIEEKLVYYKYDLDRGRYVSTQTGPKSSYALFRHMPIPILRLTGALLYRHIG